MTQRRPCLALGTIACDISIANNASVLSLEIMTHNLKTNDIADILASIRGNLSEAYTAFESGGDREWPIQGAFIRTRVLLAAVGLLEALKALQQIEISAASNWGATEIDKDNGEPYLVWSAKLYQYLYALETTFGEPKATTVTKDVIRILRATQYSITDRNCFQNPPANENDVHVRVEAVLRCVFPDLRHKPPIAKPIKNFQPDTGLSSIGTLIEYKFIADPGEEKRIADEILADTRGYSSKEWKSFIYVIYETKRIKPESQWRQLLRESGVESNTEVIVISGEEPGRSTAAKPATRPAK